MVNLPEKYVFLVSTGRTGTHFLADFFSDKQDTLSFHEPKPAFKRRGYELISRDYTFYEKLYFKSFRLFRSIGRPEPVYFEANNFLFSCIPMIREIFENTFIVHVIRDARDVIRSYINSEKRYANPGESNLNPHHFPDDPYQDQWKDMNMIEKTAWFWLRVNEQIEQSKPDLTLYFEELFAPPHEQMNDLLKIWPENSLSKSQIKQKFQRKHHTSKEKFIPKWQDWPSLWKNQLVEICGDRMVDYGYELKV